MIMQAKTLEQYMATYGPVLGAQISQAVRPLHTPGKDKLIVCKLKRKPFEAQEHVITGAVRHLNKSKSLIIVGEMGTGKTFMSMSAVHTHAKGKPYRAFVMCPPHLVEKWKREIEETLPGASAMIATKYRDVSHLRFRCKPQHAEWWIFSQTTAKLGQPWKAVYKVATPAQARLNTYARVRGWNAVPHAGHCFCSHCGHPATKTKKHNTEHLEPSQLERAQTECEHCGEQLWQWENSFDRWPLSRFIQRLGRGIIDYFILDEAHESKSADTEIAIAAHGLMSISRHVLALTGTLIGGYADHLFTMAWRLYPHVMKQHGLKWEGLTEFNEKYGRIEYKVVSNGSGKMQSTKMARGKQITGKTQKTRKPGIMPRLFVDLLMEHTVFLSLSEVADNLPELVQHVERSDMDSDIRSEYERMKTAITAEVKRMMARRDSRLLGAMLSVLLGYPDMPQGWGEIGYYDETDDGKRWVSVYQTNDFDISGRVLPKEQQLIDICESEHAEGRQVWVFSTMTDKHDCCERLKKLLEAKGLRVKILRAKVKPCDREAWILEHGNGADVIISHPELVKTGLDLFDKGGRHNFCSLVFYQTGYNLFTLRQAGARHWRIGQKEQCRTFFLCYQQTMQEVALSLMGDKMTAAQAIEGTFSEEGLAALAGEDGSIEMALAKSISNAIECDAARSWSKLSVVNATKAPAPVEKPEPKKAEQLRKVAAELRAIPTPPPKIQTVLVEPESPWYESKFTAKSGRLF